MEQVDTRLRRTLSFPQIVLYGLGTTIGAGIYALLGEITQVSGYFAPWAFITAALLALLTAMSFARMVARYPRAAGAALYVEQGFKSKRLALLVGLLVVFAGVVSSSALLNGLVGYAQDFIAWDRNTLILTSVLTIGAVVCWGINFSAWVAGLITVIEVGGLAWAVSLSSQAALGSDVTLDVFVPASPSTTAPLIFSGAVLAFYAFIGFEDMVEVAEEVRDVSRVLPRAILLTLGLSSLLYLLLVGTAVLAVGPEFLAQSSAPLSDLVAKLSSVNPLVMSAIGVFAILNGALVQLIMASRVMYGLADRKQLPKLFGCVNNTTQTPLNATLVCILFIAVIALTGTVDQLARSTSLIILVIFTLVNIALVLDESRQPNLSKRAQAIAALATLVCLGLASKAVTDLFGIG